jgi:hypothetical protein
MGLGLLFMVSKCCQQQQRKWARKRAGYVKPGVQTSTDEVEVEVVVDTADDQSISADIGNSSANNMTKSDLEGETVTDGNIAKVDVEKGNDRRRNVSTNSNKLS